MKVRDGDDNAIISPTTSSFGEMEKVRADFALLLLTDEAILINQKNMLEITKNAGWKFDGASDPFEHERVYFPTENELKQYLKEIRKIREKIDSCPDIYLELLNNG